MLGMKNHFDISGSIEIREVDIAGVACISTVNNKCVEQTVKNSQGYLPLYCSNMEEPGFPIAWLMSKL